MAADRGSHIKCWQPVVGWIEMSTLAPKCRFLQWAHPAVDGAVDGSLVPDRAWFSLAVPVL